MQREVERKEGLNNIYKLINNFFFVFIFCLFLYLYVINISIRNKVTMFIYLTNN